jgi:SAM-dependent methyltransferase
MCVFDEICSAISEQFNSSVKQVSMYEPPFSNLYNLESISKAEMDIYTLSAFDYGNKILEVACGNGRVTIPLLNLGFQVTGIDISQDMLEILQRKAGLLPRHLQNNLTIIFGDIFEYKTSEKFDLIIIPATTLGILAHDDEKTQQLFTLLKGMLAPEGAILFDLRLLEDSIHNDVGEVISRNTKRDGHNGLILSQTWVDVPLSREITKFFYIEETSPCLFSLYLSASEKRLFSDVSIENTVQKLGLVIAKTERIELDGLPVLMYLVVHSSSRRKEALNHI